MQSDEVLLGRSIDELLDSLPARISSPLFRWAQQTPDAVAVRDHNGRCCTYRELAEEVRSAADFLRELGVGPPKLA